MPFKPGNNLSKGRTPGALNKRTQTFIEVMQKHDFCAATALIECYRDAKKIYDSYGIIYDALTEAKIKTGDPFPVEDKADKYLKICLDAAKDLASYSFPKLKAIEQEKNNPLDGMSPEQKLEALQQAVKVLEMQVKK